MYITNHYSAWGDASCKECSRKEVCKYADDVQSYISSHSAPPEIECLRVEYKCKYFDACAPYATRTINSNVLDAKTALCSQVDKI